MLITNPKIKRVAGQILVLLFSGILVFHLFVVFQIIPYDIAWGGRLQSLQQMYVFEAISILLNSFFLWTVAMYCGFVKRILPLTALKVVLWIMIALFSLNTLGNLNALNSL
jgi:hypothetical protein